LLSKTCASILVPPRSIPSEIIGHDPDLTGRNAGSWQALPLL